MPRELFEERLRVHHPDFYAWERRKADGIGMTGGSVDKGMVTVTFQRHDYDQS